MPNDNAKHEVLTFFHLLLHNGQARCTSDSELIQFLSEFTEAMGCGISKHIEIIKETYGREMAVHMLMVFINDARTLDSDFWEMLFDAQERISGVGNEKEEHVN
tara:strand:- start:1019 stop:1330 length:312 start_codon:yes stop_codon:yes gene_type:complete